MAANCGDCGALVEPEGPGLHVPNDTHLHFSGTCVSCGAKVQWHQTVSGFAGLNPVLGPPRSCPSWCRHHDTGTIGPSRV
jgi:hypothetical protein